MICPCGCGDEVPPGAAPHVTRDDPDAIVAKGGFRAPTYLENPRYFAVVTMKPWRQRWRLWLRGEPTFDIAVYDRDAIPSPLASLPRMTATRQGVTFEVPSE